MSENKDSLSVRPHESGFCERCGQYGDTLFFTTLTSAGKSESMILCRDCAMQLRKRVAKHNARQEQAAHAGQTAGVQTQQAPAPKMRQHQSTQTYANPPMHTDPRSHARQQASPESKNNSRGILIVVLILVIVMIVMCGILIFMLSAKKNPKTDSAAVPVGAVGSITSFGQFEQDNDPTNGAEQIEWVVLDKQDGKALLISKYALDSQPYNAGGDDATWETCSLRTWLNGPFIDEAFSAEMRSAILTTTVTADKAPGVDRDQGQDTQDKVFLLSYTEVEKYFASEDRFCAPTRYATERSVYACDDYSTDDGEPTCPWWLRTIGSSSENASVIYADGQFYFDDCYIGENEFGVRPAVWVLATDSGSDTSLAAAEAMPTAPQASIGSVIRLGTYEQDGNTSNGREPIEWVVLHREGDKALVVSRYVLDCKPYNETDTAVTWETCTLRAWLNGSFLNESFSASERAVIQTSTVTADAVPNVKTSQGRNTQDKVFLLSYDESEKYFASEADKRCAPTDYADQFFEWNYNDKPMADGRRPCSWWLRSTGCEEHCACNIENEGGYSIAFTVDYEEFGVRPAMYVTMGTSAAETDPASAPATTAMPNVSVGDMIRFGTYEQDGNAANGKEAIDWIVLAKDDGKVLVISKYVLDCRQYHNVEDFDVSWETCSLRSWLNGAFWNNAFSPQEQGKICTTTVHKIKTYSWKPTDEGNETQDKVFLLSWMEADQYFASDADRACAPTSYAAAQGISVSYEETTKEGELACTWWLRTPGYNSWGENVIDDGRCTSGYPAIDTHTGIRPAIWIELGS